MTTFLIAFIFFIIAVLFMAISLHFSRYKKRKTGGCGCALDESSKDGNHSESCPVCRSEEGEQR
jgi:hypothetical protein